jgi:molecular chaperone DnaK (HSP70)
MLVFDFGGGTFDVSILEANSGKLEQKAIDGDIMLGGRDLDLLLVDYCATEIKKRWGKDALATPRLRQNLLDKCEKLKMELTTSMTAR